MTVLPIIQPRQIASMSPARRSAERVANLEYRLRRMEAAFQGGTTQYFPVTASTLPDPIRAGRIRWKTSDSKLYVDDGSAWIATPSQAEVDAVSASVTVLDTQLGPTGTATIANGTSSITVTHNFGSTSYRATATPTADLGLSRRFWIANKTANDFDIVTDANVSGAKTFEWIVRGS